MSKAQYLPLFGLLGLALNMSGCGGGGASTPPSYPPAPPVSAAEAVLLLEQSTFGPTLALISHVQSVGIAGFVDEQLAMSLRACSAGLEHMHITRRRTLAALTSVGMVSAMQKLGVRAAYAQASTDYR